MPLLEESMKWLRNSLWEVIPPCLAPYDQLPEKEKDYDRATAGETLKAILKLGYRITG